MGMNEVLSYIFFKKSKHNYASGLDLRLISLIWVFIILNVWLEKRQPTNTNTC